MELFFGLYKYGEISVNAVSEYKNKSALEIACL
jgi:hypothetical protein